TLSQQIVGRFLTTNTARAKHRDLLVMKAIFVGFPPCGELTKGGRLGVNRTVESRSNYRVSAAKIT
ncbi:hypothetical protein N9E83_02025, partial [Ascidiaceihabitans sp.]|nr:hypothetical protein [Ascidiaceihabitans sp.]